MAVLVAFEESQKVCQALRSVGVEAYSNDIVETRGRPEWHLQGDAMEVIFSRRWDGIVAHPVCQYLANSGAKHLYKEGRKENGPDPERWDNMRKAASEFKHIWLHAPTDYLAIENPRMLGYAREIIGVNSTQNVQPWEFGHKNMKETHFWLKGLPPLKPTKVVGPPPLDPEEKKKWETVYRAPPGPNRARDRSETFQGIAEAIADQWSPYFLYGGLI